MRKRHRIVIVIAVLLVSVLSALAWKFLLAHEPSYHGKSLTFWLNQRAEANEHGQAKEADDAIHQIGTNALPWLLKFNRVKDSNIRLKLRRLYSQQSMVSIDSLESSYDDLPHCLATTGYEALGGDAKNAVPDLILLLDDPELRETAIKSLGCIGPAAQEAVPAIISYLNDKDEFVRGSAMHALGQIHAQPNLAVPALMPFLRCPKFESLQSLWALGNFGGEARMAIPAILPLLKVTNVSVRDLAANTLLQIDPNALTPHSH